jgi:hypothetical protein
MTIDFVKRLSIIEVYLAVNVLLLRRKVAVNESQWIDLNIHTKSIPPVSPVGLPYFLQVYPFAMLDMNNSIIYYVYRIEVIK